MDKLEDKMTIFTPEDFQDEEELIAKTAELFIKQDVSPNTTAIEKHQYEVTRQLFQKAGDLGLLAIEIPEDYGGWHSIKNFRARCRKNGLWRLI